MDAADCNRLNQKPADISFTRKEKGGVSISKSCRLTHLDDDTIKAICKEYRTPCANITFRCNATADELIDIIEGNRSYIPCLYVLNKIGEKHCPPPKPARPAAPG